MKKFFSVIAILVSVVLIIAMIYGVCHKDLLPEMAARGGIITFVVAAWPFVIAILIVVIISLIMQILGKKF